MTQTMIQTATTEDYAPDTSITLHMPDRDDLQSVLSAAAGEAAGPGEPAVPFTVGAHGDSYREWEEEREGDDPAHVTMTLPMQYARAVMLAVARAGVLVNATLTKDYSTPVQFEGVDVPGWQSMYPRHGRL